ncbi:polysaccharide biosynthesis C-terminal domain-containing protein [Natrinema thermotolerans]|uniref:Polysaccharide biosynthesis C-terminal domain-containing protein n=1 Tax=Natrinema thermotolerans TaxID=121872 RepID=A0AAF0T623_9EURY|nr:polysaccharide biosynthesis C-terminal domain-containing protein [Natrinema thermotolerans]QCC60454.1 flippase [Natrinema thermotolerans]QCC61357.1 flippase [Natrinema thermotolerans]WMT07487.1 polysaccharide biosynthesis C-terminal domain-containing protein [Natrinema thermotolerans]WMT08119.1 polysaccharide biosynthesis C-terminal domain-containing protein [Natrinema thermotolerans]
MNLAQSSLKIFVAKIGAAILNFLAIIIFSRKLGAAPLGTYYPFIALVGILSIPTDFGISSATEKRISEGADKSKYLGTAIALKFPPLILISLLIHYSRRYVTQYLGADLTLALIVALFVRQTAQLSVTVLRGEMRVGETALVEILRPIGWISSGYVLYLQGYGVYSLVYGYLVGSTLMLIVGWWKVSTPISNPTLEHVDSLIDYGKFSVISSIGDYFYNWMDVAMLSVFVAVGTAVTRGEIGAYENAWRLSLVVMLLSQSIATALFPQVSHWNADGAVDQIESVIPTALLPAFLLVTPAFVGIAVLSRDLLKIMFGPEFTVAWFVLIILAGEKVFQAVHVVLGRSLQAIDRPDLAAYATAVSILVNLVLNVVLIWKFGIVGAAIATTLSFIVNTSLHAHYLTQFLNIDFPVQKALWSIVASAAMGICVYSVQIYIEINTIIELGSVICFGVLVYGSIVLVYSPIREIAQRLVSPMIEFIP